MNCAELQQDTFISAEYAYNTVRLDAAGCVCGAWHAATTTGARRQSLPCRMATIEILIQISNHIEFQ